MSKLSFRARALDAGKPMPIFMAEELPDLPDFSAINRAVPQMPSGMQKEEECEHHLQRAICAGLIIPTPEVTEISSKDIYDKMYPANYKQPRQLIHMQPFTMEQDIPDYDMDSEDERWLQSQANKLDLSPLKFEEMMDRLEKSSGQTVVTLNEAKALLKEDDDLIIAVYDYWLNKRLKTQHPLILSVKTEHRPGQAANNPYLAFRRRTEKMQTRKNRKNDEASYEKMLKLRRDLCRAVTLLELVKRREKMKREHVHLTVEVFEKRYQAKDFSGAVVAEAAAAKASQRPAFTPIFHNHYPNQSWSNKAILKDEVIPRREKRQYKKRKHKSHGRGIDSVGTASSDEEGGLVPQLSPEPEDEDEGPFAFRRNKLCSYHMPLPTEGNWPWSSPLERGLGDKRYRYTLTSISQPTRRCVGFTRRRVGRGGRVVLDRAYTDYDDLWRTLDYSVIEPRLREVESSVPSTSGSESRVKTEEVVGEGSAPAASRAVKSEPADRTSETGVEVGSVSSEISAGVSDVWQEPSVSGVKVKVEPLDEVTMKEERVVTEEEKDDMVEFLRSLRRDWPHFRPKTPPPGWSPPCHLLPPSDDEDLFPNLEAGRPPAPFQIEVQPLDSPTTALFGSDEPFLTDPFFEMGDLDGAEVPVTDTRQTDDYGGDRGGRGWSDSSSDDTIGCSRFTLTDLEASVSPSHRGTSDQPKGDSSSSSSGGSGSQSSGQTKQNTSSTSSSLKVNSMNGSECKNNTGGDSGMVNSTNGLLAQFGLDVPANNRTKNNKLPTYAYSSSASVGYSNTLSLHTSAHTLTLNSHSANILDIPIADEPDPKLVNSHHQSGASEGTPSTPTTPSNKPNKTLVRKNNLIMEVT